MKIVLAGGTGNIGKLLLKSFVDNGDEVIVLSRSSRNSDEAEYIGWDGRHISNWVYALEGADVLINLCGEGIAKRFTSENKKILIESRIQPTKVLGEAISQINNPPRLWINFSGISIYNGLDTIQDESSTTYGDDFLASLTKDWEQCFFDSQTPSTLKIALRISAVLATGFGMFQELYPLAKMGLAGTVASGRQYVSWIHQDDLVRLIKWLVQKENPRNIYHACSPHPVTNRDFMSALRNAVGCRIGIPLPRQVAKLGAFAKGVDSSLLLQTTP